MRRRFSVFFFRAEKKALLFGLLLFGNRVVRAEPTSPSPGPEPSVTAERDPLLRPVPPPARLVRGWRDALALVRSRSTDLQIALGNVARAEAAGRIALAGLLPTLTATGNVTNQALRTVTNPLTGQPTVQVFPSNATSYGASATLTVPLIAPRAWYAPGTADRSKAAAEFTLQDQKRTLAAAVASALVSLISAERVSDLNRVGLQAALERRDLTKRRAELGSATGLDVLRVEQDAAKARAQIVTGDESLRQAREAFGLALGFPEAFGVPTDLNLETFAQESERACVHTATIADRPDVAAAMTNIEVAQRNVRDVELQFFPTINLVSTYSYAVQPFVNTLASRTINAQTWSIGGVLNWNIFDGGIRYGNLRDTRAQATQARARAEATRRTAIVQVLQASRGVQVAEQSLTVVRQTRDLSRETDRLARLNFTLGRGTSLDLVDAARQLREAEIQLVIQEFTAVQAKITALLSSAACDY